MRDWTIIPVIFALLSVLAVLVIGLVQFARKGERHAAQSNRLMRLRVFFQFATVLLLLLIFLFS